MSDGSADSIRRQTVLREQKHTEIKRGGTVGRRCLPLARSGTEAVRDKYSMPNGELEGTK